MADAFFRVHRSALMPVLTSVFEAVDTRATIPMLQNILLQPVGSDLMLRATDFSIEIEASCELVDQGTGTAITLSGADLREIVKNLPESAVIEFAPGKFPGQVAISAGRARFNLLSLPADAFPSIAAGIKGNPFPIDTAAFISAMGRVLYAIREDDKARVYLSGVAVHPETDNRIAVVGCDGHNLAVVRFPTEVAADFPLILMPLKTAKAIRKLFADSKAHAEMTASESMLCLRSGGVTVLSKLIDATYPDYMRTVPTHYSKKVVAPVDQLRSTMNRVCLLAKDLSKDTVRVSVSTASMRLSLANDDGEGASEDFPIEYDGDAIEIGFNGKYITQMLHSIQTQDVVLDLEDAGTPGKFRTATDSDEFYIVMPRSLK